MLHVHTNVGRNYRFVIVLSIFDIHRHQKLNVTLMLQQTGTLPIQVVPPITFVVNSVSQ